jgi:hypothetical protein
VLHRGRVFAWSTITAMLKRRAFLATAGVAAAHLATAGRTGALACARPTSSARARVDRIGRQLHTVRAARERNVEGTLTLRSLKPWITR